MRKAEAKRLRQQGSSINEIATTLGAAKSSVSIWTRDVTLSNEHKVALRARSHTEGAIEKRRLSRLSSEETKRASIIMSSYDEVGNVSQRELWLIGTALYWAEGGKTKRMVRFSNGDPAMIRLMMRYFRDVCMVPEERFRGHIHIHENLNISEAEEYWSSVSSIPLSSFYKTYSKPNISSKGLRRTLPYGVFDIYVSDSKLFLKILGWTKALSNQ